MKRTCICVVLLTIAIPAGTAFGEPKSFAAAAKNARPGQLLDLLPGRTVIDLQPIANTGSFDVKILKDGNADAAGSIYIVIGRGTDYVTLRGGNRTVYLPAHSIRSITGRPIDPLATLVTGKFFRMPLQEFVGTIARTAGVEIRIDGAALKDSGYTKNMPQNVTVNKVPAEQLLAELFKRYTDMVLTKPGGHYLITTRAYAKNRGEKVRELKPAGKKSD